MAWWVCGSIPGVSRRRMSAVVSIRAVTVSSRSNSCSLSTTNRSTPPISRWPALFTRNPCAPAVAGFIEARSKDIRGCRIVRPEPLPCRVVHRHGRIPLGVDGAEEAEWLFAVVDPAVRRAGRHTEDIERFQSDDLLGHQGFTSTAQDHDAVHMPVLLEAGVAAGRQLKVSEFEARWHDWRTGKGEPADIAPPHAALVAEGEFVRLRLHPTPAEVLGVEGNLQPSQRGGERAWSLMRHGHANSLYRCIAYWTSL